MKLNILSRQWVTKTH
ncbi:unnamed protein product [Tuber melanosporum]|uniref:(Perigord truffle) hypothetical protein n=1 Tax=Tuber melanosporum (strain Mel28) TaxID=656061 RepID=D5G4Z4_TUBMM|nr:unnamed protein product [Tuber melanosporum]